MNGFWDQLGAVSDPSRAFFARLPRVTTERLVLRPLRMRDAADFYAYAQDPEVARYVLWDAHTSIHESRSYLRWNIRQYRAGQPGSWGMELRETGQMIGTIGFMSYSAEHGCGEIGYSMGRAWWGQGIATEALRAVIDVSFRSLPLHRLEAFHDVDNPASGRVMAKSGMTREGVLAGRVCNKGQFRDVVMWRILREEWKPQR